MKENNNGNDTNVCSIENSIEEAIEIVESIIEEYENCSVPEIDMQVNVTFREKQNNALNHILSDYKRVLKINEVLVKENEELKKLHIQDNKHLDFIMEHSIPVQKVKDKIEKEIKYHEKNILDIENITMLKSKTDKEEAEIEFNKYAIVVLKKMLQELLEGRK